MANTTSGDGNASGLNPARRALPRQYHTQDMDLELRNADAMFFGSGYALSTPMEQLPVSQPRPFPTECRTWIQPLNFFLMGQDELLLGLGRQLTYDWQSPRVVHPSNIHYMTNTQQRAPFTGMKSFGGADSNEWTFTTSSGAWAIEESEG